jgi:hypothetical protein
VEEQRSALDSESEGMVTVPWRSTQLGNDGGERSLPTVFEFPKSLSALLT